MLVLEQEENKKDGSNTFPMHENFRLIATQNPNDTSYICKREELPEKLLQLFNIIYFPALTKKEITDIAKNIAKKNNYKNEKIIEEIVNIHSIVIDPESVLKSPQCFTIRDINSVIKSISKRNNP